MRWEMPSSMFQGLRSLVISPQFQMIGQQTSSILIRQDKDKDKDKDKDIDKDRQNVRSRFLWVKCIWGQTKTKIGCGFVRQGLACVPLWQAYWRRLKVKNSTVWDLVKTKGRGLIQFPKLDNIQMMWWQQDWIDHRKRYLGSWAAFLTSYTIFTYFVNLDWNDENSDMLRWSTRWPPEKNPECWFYTLCGQCGSCW